MERETLTIESDERLDAACVDRLWRANRRFVAAILLAHRPRRCELDDLLQEVATTLVEKGHTVRDEGAMRGWLRTVALNVARGHGRKRTRRGEDRIRTLDAETPALARADASADACDALAEFHERLAGLPETYREPLLLRTIHGCTSAAVGELLGISEDAVNTRIARARRMLAQAGRERTEPGGSSAHTAAERPRVARHATPNGRTNR